MNTAYPYLIDLCILIPCYNNIGGLIESLKSVKYAKNKYVIIIADDGSVEPVSSEYVSRYVPDAAGIEVIRLEKNEGITKALNKGLAFIYANYSTRFVARLDCGDTCSPQRFYTQVEFFEQHPNIDLTGTWCYFKNKLTGEAYKYITPTAHNDIKRDMYFRNVFIHPTVMWRNNSAIKLLYPENFPCAEDYGLFYDMISTRQSAIINEFLVTCEINQQGISILQRSMQLKSRLKVVSFYGKNKLLYFIGALKLNLLMLMPHKFIFITKKLIYKAT